MLETYANLNWRAIDIENVGEQFVFMVTRQYSISLDWLTETAKIFQYIHMQYRIFEWNYQLDSKCSETFEIEYLYGRLCASG